MAKSGFITSKLRYHKKIVFTTFYVPFILFLSYMHICPKLCQVWLCFGVHVVNSKHLKLTYASNFSLQFVYKQGSLGPRQNRILSNKKFRTKLSPYLYTSKTTITQQQNKTKQKKKSKNLPYQNGGQNTYFYFVNKVT